MLQYVLWAISFVTLWLILVWLNFLYAAPTRKRLAGYPKISFGIPAHNEKETILKTVKSILAADYPANKKEIIVVDDGSTDGTSEVVRKFVRSADVSVKVVRQLNGGKAAALNTALDHSTGDFFAVVDADSRISADSIKKSMPNFSEKRIGAVISRVKVDEPKNFLERIQRFEYIMSGMTRKIMCNFGTLYMTPGVLSIYRADVLRKVGGFTHDRTNLTEDLEIAMRLKCNGYSIKMEPDSITYTNVPDTMPRLWAQRVRWARGYIYNHWNYRHMLFSRKHGMYGVFQMPLNVVAVLLLVGNVGIIAFDLFDRVFDFVFRSFTIPDYFLTTMTDFPTLKQLILARNIQVYLPIIIAFILGTYLIIFAHRMFNERFRRQIAPLITYVIVMPYFSTVNWISSIVQEVSKSKRKW